MKKFLFAIFIIAVSANIFSQQENNNNSTIRVMTYNVRNNWANDGADDWSVRKDKVLLPVNELQPDIFGVQEAFADQVDFLAENCSGYLWAGEGREGGRRGEHCTIFYKQDNFELLADQTLWLSDTPEKKSKTWGNTIWRIITICDFKERSSGKMFKVINAHFDHMSENARLRSAVMIAEIVEKSKLPVVVMGDLNAVPDSAPIKILLGSFSYKGKFFSGLYDSFYSLHLSNPDLSANGTFHGFSGITKFPRIDYVMFTNPFIVAKAGVYREQCDGRYPSDHFPVYADLKF